MKPVAVIGFLGSTLDSSKFGPSRWNKWRPSVGLTMHEDLRVDRFILLHGTAHRRLADYIVEDIASVSPETGSHCVRRLRRAGISRRYGTLLDFARAEPSIPGGDYLILSRGDPRRTIACSCSERVCRAGCCRPSRTRGSPPMALDDHRPRYSRYDSIATRFAAAAADSTSFLKSGIETRNGAFNTMIDEIEHVAGRSRAPVLLMGPTGAGKSQLARRIHELKRLKHQIGGAFVEVNCATLKGDGAMSALFGHRKGAFTGAVADRPGLLRAADKGMLFLDEIGELGLDEQAMILRAIEDKRFLPVGSDKEAASEFQLIAGTNRGLGEAVAAGSFRDDLYARLNLWTFHLPGLADRREDIEPNLATNSIARRARERGGDQQGSTDPYLAFAMAGEASWAGNFRDLARASRGCDALSGGRIDVACVEAEI